MPRPFLPLLLTLALAACDVSTVVTPVSSDAAQPNAVSITETSITDDQVTVSWSASGSEPAEHWRLYQNNLLVCSADLDLELSSSDASGNYQQSDTCTLTLEDGENSIYVQLCNISENSTSTCSTSAIKQIFYAAADPTPGAISWQDLPSSTSATTISATWLKADGGNGDYWFVYHDGAQACTGNLSYVEDYVAQSADCTISLAEGVNQLQAELCSDQPAGIQDLCSQSEVASVTFVLDPGKELATPVLDALDEDIHYAGIDTNISWYKDTSSGSAGDAWSLYHNGTVVCQAQLAAEATSASCIIQLVEGDNALQVELCTDIATYSGASCAQSNTLAVSALDPEPVTPGLIRIANVSTTLAETSDSVAPLEWVIDIGNGVQHWSVDLNGVEYCVTSSTSEYYQQGSCLLNLVVGINTISVRGCNYGYDDVAACSTSEAITTERVALPGTPELTSSLPATTYAAEHNLSWERTTGASAERWLAFVDGDIESDQCHTELNPQTPQSDSCIVELGSGINEVLVRLCVDSSTAAYCVDSASLYTELLAPIPATPEISTASQSIADDSIELEWSKSSGEHGSYWLAWNNDAEVAACADRPLLSAGDGQSGSCDLPLAVGENIVSVRLCNDNNASTASCADSTTISITRLVASPEFTSATSVSTAENSVAVFYTATVEDNDSSAEQISFALSGGADVDFFQLDSTSGALAFHTPVDYEIPQDSDADNVYQLNITATDELEGSAQLELAVSLSNANDNLPILTTPPASLAVAENDSSVIYTFTASDLDGDALSYSLDGADAQHLTLGAASGTLQFQSAPDYETPLDANQDNVYELNISVSDGEYHSSALLSIVVDDSNDEVPQATSASSVALAIDSLVVGATIYTATATDADASDQITYGLGGADQQHFTLDTSSGELAFSQLPTSLDDPQDANGDNIYEVLITLTDLGANSSELNLSVSVVAFLGSIPEFAAASASAAFDENAVGAVYTAQATDADEEVLSYSIAGDDAEHFTIDTTSGALEFTSPPDYEQPTDSDSDNIYDLAISATDPVGNQAQQSLTVSINNLNDNAPQFASSSAELSISENNTSITTITASDADADTLTYAITASADSELFTIDPASGALAFISAPNYESPQDANADNVYQLAITATDGAYSASQDLTITVADVNEAPAFTEPSVALTTAENNSSFIYTVAAAIDPDQGQTLTYQLSGADASAFDFEPTTRALVFKTTPDFESPTDQDADNTYQIAITATDGEYSASQDLVIAVADLNDETPQFTSPSSQSVDYSTAQVGAIVYTAQASDADAGDQITYALGGADSGHFSFDPSSGALAFFQLPALADFPEDGSITYLLSITATDLAANSSTLDLSVSLLDDTGSAPTFAQASVSIAVDENSADTVYSAQASDVDSGDILSYSISGSDADSFTINSSSGALAFQQAPDFENPADDNSDNTYELIITVTDSMAKQAQQSLSITVNNLNDNSPQFTLSSSAFSVSENSSGVASISASDADGDDLTFSLTNTSDTNLFTLDPSSGALAFAQAPDFETPLDSDGDNVYQLSLSAFDGANTATQAITVSVANIDEAPSFAAATQDLSISENSSGSVYQAQATDPEQATLTYSASGADASLFTLDPTSGALAFNSPPNYEQPSDADTDNTYQLSITASDGANQATQAVAITIADVNEAPSFTAASVALATAENNLSFIYTAAAAIDPDQGQTLTYQLSGTDAAAFNFDAATRTLSFQQSPDFEAAKDQDADNVYQLSVVASDGEYQASQSITITVADLNDEAPRFTSLGSQVVDYTKVEVGDVIYTATATDADLGDQITYALSGADAITFTLDSASGALAFAQLPPLEQFPEDSGITYQLVIAAADLAANSSTLDLTVSLLDDTGSAPEFAEASASVAVDENIATTIYTAQATDVDPDDTLSYSLSGIDHQLFSIDAASGALTFNSPPDHEQPLDDDGDNVYDLAIVVTDSPVGNQAQQSLTVSVTNLNDNPPQFALSSSTFSIPENSTAITTVAASDADGDDLTFSLTNSTDSSLFAIDPTSGVLVFVSAPDFENPADDNSDNTYELELSVDDGANTITQAITVAVTDIDEAPSFASVSESLSISENSSGSVYQAQASDPEQATLAYSISGVDASRFNLDASSGDLTFKTSPNFESPLDQDANNVYELSIAATDGANSASQAITISVSNVNEAPAFASASVALDTAENNLSFVHIVDAAVDPDSGEQLTYQLGGDDQSAFDFDVATRALAFKSTPDYESPEDQGADNVYQINIVASDSEYSTSQAISIAVAGLNDEAPQFTSASTQSVDYSTAQVGAIVYSASATDADAGDQITYALGGADAANFDFDSSSGELSFNQLPELEDFPAEGSIDYALSITATDLAANSSELALSISLLDDTGSAPTFAQASASINVDENTASTVYTAQATDVDVGDSLTYSISGTDSSLFTIDPSSGDLSFNTAPDFETPADSGGDNIYDLSITATDAIGKQAQQSLAISVNNLNDNPPQFALSSTAFDVPENTTAIATIAATDPDGDDLTLALIASADSNFFTLDPASGALAFISAPDFETPQDVNTDNTYELELSVADGDYTTTQAITVAVANIDEAPSFAAATQDLPVNENSSGSIYQAQASDPEQAVLAYSASGADASLFTLDDSSGDLTFKTEPNFEQPLDQGADNTYNLTITASDGTNQASQAVTVTVADVNEPPTFASASVNLNTDENDLSFTHIVDAADDPDQGETLTYQLGGDDAAAFDFDTSTSALSFKATPDYESPQDQDSNNVYQIAITAADSQYSTSQAINIAVADLNDEAPQFTSASSLALDFTSVVVGTTVYTAQATDADANDQITYALSGADASAFSLDNSSGALAFTQAPSLDSPQDADGDNFYQLSITATDLANNSTDLALSINVVDDTGSAPTFAQASASIAVDENTASTVYTAQATDVDPGDILTYSIAGTDSSLFTIDPSSGDLSFNTAPDYENPADSGGNNTYELSIAATDAIGKQASQSLTITVNNLNDNPPQFALSANSFDVAENSTAVTAIAASDADGDDLTFSLTNSADASFFTLDPTSGVLAFVSAPDFENPADDNTDNTYELELSVADVSHTTTQEITITVTNVDEAPSFAAATVDLPINENTSGSIYTAAATDPEQATLTYSASGTDAGLFDLDSASGELTFKQSPNFEKPLDSDSNNVYQLDITATDGANQASQSITVTVADVNEAPTFASASVNIDTDENDASFVHIVNAADDPDQGETLTYQLSGDDAAAFDFDAATRALSFKATPDYESPQDQDSNNVYQINIVASDSEYDAAQAITIAVADLNDEAPQFTSASSLALDYTSVVLGTTVYTAQATDADANDQVSYTLGGADASAFSLDNSSGELAFAQAPSLENPKDADKDNVYQLSIAATDLGANSTDLALSINVVDDTGSAPTFDQASASIAVDENTASAVYTAQATDVDPGDILTYSISGTDSSLFTINPSSGELAFISAPDFENPTDNGQNNTYDLSITATDAIGKQASQSLAITVNNLNDNPPQFALASSAFDVLENSTTITTIAATDADGDDLSFSLISTTDSSHFTLDPASGALSFNQAPDFETPQDANADNTYELELSVADGDYTTTQAITISVANIDEAPSFAAATQDLPVNENSSGSIYTAQATDPEGAALTYSASGADASLFTLDDSSGDLTFKTEPNFEQPLDQGADNTYNLTITASDGTNQASQAVTVTVADVNEPPTFASASVNLDIDENDVSFAHTVDAATDPDQGETLTYQLGGDDQSAFNFDTSTRNLSFQQSPDYENPKDQGADNTYQITITAADSQYSTSQAITIAVADLNDEAPQFTSASSLALDYTSVVVGATVYTAQASDADANDQLSYTLGGADSSHFSFNTSSGELAFTQLPNLESPQDANTDNTYELTITATDLGANSTDLALSVNVVDDTGSAPTFASASASISVDENSAGTVYTAQASDVDPGDSLTYSIDGTDSSHFTIGSSNGELSFNTAPDYEQPADNGKDNTYDLSITATDAIGKQASQSLAISVNNLNDNSPQFVLSSTAFDVPENSTAVATVAATDVDGDTLTFALITSTDAAAFVLDPASGVLVFAAAPDFENPADNNADNTYQLELSVFDGSHTSTQSISVTVTNVDEAPSFASANESLSVSENTSDTVYQAQASDPEGATLTYSASGTDAELFTINSSSGELSFKTPPDFETPGDSGADNVYELTITASDGANQVSQSLAITVTNVNEAPAFASASVNLNTDENAADFAHTVEAATDPDQGETLTYQLGGDDAAAFDFDAATRVLSFKATPDYESPADQGTNNVYQITITASDSQYSTSQAITIAVADLNDEAPQFTSATSLALDYTSVAVGATVYTAQATDADANDQVSYTLGGADASAFSLDNSSGELAFAQAPSLDSPKDDNGDNIYQLTISATDLNANSTDLALSVSVVDDTGSAPTFAQAGVSISVDENTASTIYTAQASNVDPGDILTYSISGTDSSLFTIGSSSGELSFNTAPDYENPSDNGKDNTYELTITATDSIGKQAQQSLTISVNNLNDNSPQFALASSAFDVLENATAVATIAATDADGDDLSFSLISTTDSSHFTLDPASGALSFNQAPDFETPQDSNADNTYELELSASDGTLSTSQAISVTVTNIDEAPTFTAANESVSVSENTSGSVYQAQASDPEQASLAYSVSGTDAGLFTINNTSGDLAFTSAPNFEQPTDQGANNVYNLDIVADDGDNQSSQALTVTVADVNEAPSFASTSVNIDTDENAASFAHIVAAATDEDSGQTLAYSLSGDDASEFNFDTATRALSFKQAPDFENPEDQNTDNAYQITITASDGDLQATQAITITVNNVEESPYFHSTADYVDSIAEDPATEGTASPVLALTIQAADDEDDSASKSLNFVISGGADSDKFSLTSVDANSVNLSFTISPDFDNPHDSNLDNNYSLTIQVADSNGDTAQHDLIVAVQAVNDETPQLTSASSADVNENDTAVFYFATAEDADRSDWSDPDSSKHYQLNLDTLTFSLDSTNYPDSSFFAIGASSGELQAASGLDYESPQSSAQSNDYTVGIKVADQANNSSTSAITITVIDDPDESDPVASSGPQIPWFYSDVAVGESIDIPWVIYSGDGAIAWSLLVNGNTVCSESASISDPATSGVCSVSSSHLGSGTNLNAAAVSVTYSDSSSELSEEVTFAYAVSATTSRYPTPTASVSDGIAACQNVDIGDAVSSTSNVDCWNFLLGNDDFGGPYDEVPSYLTANYGRGFDVIAYYGDWSIYERGFQPAHMPVNLLSTALYSFIMLDGDIPATQAANADEKECEDCSFSGAVDFADYYSAIHKAYSLPDDPLATDKWLGTEGVGDGYVAYGTGIGEHWTDDSAYKGNGIFKQFWLLKQKFPHFKTCISVGGWSFSRPFPLIASDSTKLATFVESITDMAVKYHFDCIDIDWEFPGKAGGDYVNNNSAVVYDYDGDGKTPFITPTAADAGYFVNLISALRAELDSRSEASHIEINSAVYTSEDGMALMDYNAFAGNLDGIHMMTYDYYGAWDAHTGLQAALYANSDPVHSEVSVLHGDVYNNKHNIASAMARAVNNAIDNGFGSNHDIRRKIVPGLAFYGRNYSGVSTTPVPGKYMVLANSAAEQLSWEQGNLNYIQIEGYYEDGATMSGNSAYDAGGYNTAGRSWTYRWDSESMAPFLYDASTGSFIGYTDPRAIFYQTCHAARENSKGVMFWEMTQDSSDFQLVQAIHTALRGDTLSQYADQPHCDDIIDRDITSNNDDDDNGGDTGGGNDDDDDGGDTGGSDTGDTGSGTSGLQELEDLGYFTETVFNSLFYNTTLNQGSSTDGACTGYSFFNNWLDLKEAATYYPDFAAEGSMEDRLRELAAFLANTSHETTGAWQTYALDPALGARYHYGYCFKEEVGCENQTSCTQYCDSANTEYGYACSLGTTYHGRGPIQFTWNYNYGAMSEVLYGNNNYTLLENPSILVTDAVISYRSALWFWMTVQAPKPSAHDVMIGNYSAEASKNRYPGFGMTINIINGGLECGTDDFAEAKNKNRLGFYLAYLKVLGDAYGREISPWVTESSTSTTHGSTPATYSAFDLNEEDLISRYTDVETYLSCKNMEHY